MTVTNCELPATDNVQVFISFFQNKNETGSVLQVGVQLQPQMFPFCYDAVLRWEPCSHCTIPNHSEVSQSCCSG